MKYIIPAYLSSHYRQLHRLGLVGSALIIVHLTGVYLSRHPCDTSVQCFYFFSVLYKLSIFRLSNLHWLCVCIAKKLFISRKDKVINIFIFVKQNREMSL